MEFTHIQSQPLPPDHWTLQSRPAPKPLLRSPRNRSSRVSRNDEDPYDAGDESADSDDSDDEDMDRPVCQQFTLALESNIHIILTSRFVFPRQSGKMVRHKDLYRRRRIATSYKL